MTATPPSERTPVSEKGAPDSPSASGSSRPAGKASEPNTLKSRSEDKGKTKERGEEEDTLEKETEEGEAPEAEESASAPPLPDEELPPPLPDEAPPGEDDGWEPVWDANAQGYYFYNRFTGVSQWENPRVPNAVDQQQPQQQQQQQQPEEKKKAPVLGGYNPAIHGDYDPTASYAQHYEQQHEEQNKPAHALGMDPNTYEATGHFNRFTGRWQDASLNPENYNDENKSRRQMNAFFDVDAAANSHDGRSLRAERSAKKLSRNELKQFKAKRKEKKEEKRRAWLRD